jgi:hypothetical protein
MITLEFKYFIWSMCLFSFQIPASFMVVLTPLQVYRAHYKPHKGARSVTPLGKGLKLNMQNACSTYSSVFSELRTGNVKITAIALWLRIEKVLCSLPSGPAVGWPCKEGEGFILTLYHHQVMVLNRRAKSKRFILFSLFSFLNVY